MKIQEATWEKRNLGKKVFEIELELDDSNAPLSQLINDLSADYFVVKIPTEFSKFIEPIQSLGFKFIEVLTHARYDSELPNLNSLEEKFQSNISVSQISDSNLAVLKAEIAKGLFTTDRISLDSNFSRKLSANRYLGMIEDECSKGAVNYEISYKENLVGFFVLRKLNDVSALSSIAGILPKYQNKGLGVLMNYFQILNSYKLGASEVLSTFSSNNIAATNIHWKFDYKLEKQEYIFVKHSD